MLPVFLFLLPSAINSLKILVYSPKYAHSHMVFLGAVADTLQLAGHDVTILQPEIIIHHKSTGCSHAKVLSVPRSKATESAANVLTAGTFWQEAWISSEFWGSSTISPMLKPIFEASCRALFHEIGLQNVIGASTYVLMEWASLAMGVPITSYVPATQGVTSDNGSIFERAKNLLYLWYSLKFQTDLAAAADKVAKERNHNAPSSFEIARKNISFCLTHSHPLLDFPRPTLFGIVDLGGIGLKKPGELDGDWENILAKREKNVLISFGSIAPASTMPLQYKKSLLKVFSRFHNHTFIWKYEKTDDPMVQGVPNLVLTKWMPQNDLLGSGKINLFVTHGGSGSIMETSSYGVPALVIPLFADQIRNAKMLERQGSGIYFWKRDIENAEILEMAVRKGLEDPGVQNSAVRMRRLLSKTPFAPQDSLVRTIELAAEVGPGGRLLPEGRNLGWVQFFNLDLIAIFLTVLLIVVGSVVKLCCGGRRKEKVQ